MESKKDKEILERMFQYCDTNKLGGIEGENFKNCLVSASIGLSYREA